MRVGIMQPYFFPYLGYFSLIKHTEQFILLDEVQFIRHGWIERNRILKPSGGWMYFAVPLEKYHRETIIKDIRIRNSEQWKEKIMAQLIHYKKAPYYKTVVDLLREIFRYNYEDIVSLNKKSLEMICDYVGFNPMIKVFSEMNLKIAPVKEADEWALNICLSLDDVNEYWNPPGGMEFFNVDKYKEQKIEIKFQKVNLTPYNQRKAEFESGLSIIDVMMFNDVADINKMLDNYELL